MSERLRGIPFQSDRGIVGEKLRARAVLEQLENKLATVDEERNVVVGRASLGERGDNRGRHLGFRYRSVVGIVVGRE